MDSVVLVLAWKHRMRGTFRLECQEVGSKVGNVKEVGSYPVADEQCGAVEGMFLPAPTPVADDPNQSSREEGNWHV